MWQNQLFLLLYIWKFFQERCLESGQQVFSTAVEISNDGIMKTSRGPSPAPLCYEKKQLLGGQAGGEQIRSQNEELPSERLPSRSLGGPRRWWFELRAASPEGVSSCSVPGSGVGVNITVGR